MAFPANAEQTVSYELVRQYPPGPRGLMAFSVSGCSGAIRVQDPTQLDFQVVAAANGGGPVPNGNGASVLQPCRCFRWLLLVAGCVH